MVARAGAGVVFGRGVGALDAYERELKKSKR